MDSIFDLLNILDGTVLGIKNPEIETLTVKKPEVEKAICNKHATIINTCGTLTVKKPEIEKVIYNKPTTIIKWSDGTKTVVKCDKEDEYDPVKGLLIAILKKNYGNKGSFYKDLVVPWLPKEEEK